MSNKVGIIENNPGKNKRNLKAEKLKLKLAFAHVENFLFFQFFKLQCQMN